MLLQVPSSVSPHFCSWTFENSWKSTVEEKIRNHLAQRSAFQMRPRERLYLPKKHTAGCM